MNLIHVYKNICSRFLYCIVTSKGSGQIMQIVQCCQIFYVMVTNGLSCVMGGGRVVRRCCVSYITGASN